MAHGSRKVVRGGLGVGGGGGGPRAPDGPPAINSPKNNINCPVNAIELTPIWLYIAIYGYDMLKYQYINGFN